MNEDDLKKAARELGRRGGLKGGRARMEKLTPEQRSAIARKAVMARWHPKETKMCERGSEHPTDKAPQSPYHCPKSKDGHGHCKCWDDEWDACCWCGALGTGALWKVARHYDPWKDLDERDTSNDDLFEWWWQQAPEGPVGDDAGAAPDLGEELLADTRVLAWTKDHVLAVSRTYDPEALVHPRCARCGALIWLHPSDGGVENCSACEGLLRGHVTPEQGKKVRVLLKKTELFLRRVLPQGFVNTEDRESAFGLADEVGGLLEELMAKPS